MKRIKIKLSKEEKVQLEELLLTHRDRKVYRRLMCIKLLDLGKTNSVVAEMYEVSLETIKNWLEIFEEKGFDGLTVLYEKMRGSSMDVYSKEILSFVENNTITTIYDVSDYVNNTLGVNVGYHAVRNFLKKTLVLSSKSRCKYHLSRQNA